MRKHLVSLRRFEKLLASDEFTFPYGGPKPEAPPLAIACQILERGANVQDVSVGTLRWGTALFREALAELDRLEAWQRPAQRAFAVEVIEAVERVWDRPGDSLESPPQTS